MRCSEWLERQQKGDFVRPVGATKSHEGPRRARGQEGLGGARRSQEHGAAKGKRRRPLHGAAEKVQKKYTLI